jgi:hypothetical protein
LKEDQKCVVRWAYTIEMPRYYSDVTSFGGVTINPTFELTEKPPNLSFWADMEDCDHAAGGLTWQYNRAFIGGQHLRVWWQPVVENARHPVPPG